MKNRIQIFTSLAVLFSCQLDDTLPRTENITSGKKWTLQIGSSPRETYSQLQELGIDKNFERVAITYRQPYTEPSELNIDLALYRAITLETASGRTDRVVFEFDENNVVSIQIGGGLLDPVSKWPNDVSDEIAIHINDPIAGIKEKLLAIYQNPVFKNYQIILSDKRLNRPFDPDMANYDQWGFSFSISVSPSREGTSSVSLFFQNQKLSKIRHVYNENDIYHTPTEN